MGSRVTRLLLSAWGEVGDPGKMSVTRMGCWPLPAASLHHVHLLILM